MQAVRDRGLIFIDSSTSPLSLTANIAQKIDLPYIENVMFVEHKLTKEDIDKNLLRLKAEVISQGSLLVIARSFPITLQRLSSWIPSLQMSGIALVPVTALVKSEKL